MGNTANKLRIIYGDCTLGIKGDDFHYIFSYTRGGLESLNKKGKEWLYRVPTPTFWRAVTDNDRNNSFAVKSSMWLGADLFQRVVDRVVRIDDAAIELPIAPVNNQYSNSEAAQCVEIRFTFETSTVPSTTVEVSYKVQTDGRITVSMHYHGRSGLPELPLLGMRFILPTKAKGYVYEGLSGETYPDRMAGGINGIYSVEGLPVTPYLVPQDCGVHMDSEWVEITRNATLNNNDQEVQDFSIRFENAGEKFAFSCLPYTAEELENAMHIEELPLPRRTVLLILAKVRGVGGIDSWGSDVEEAYRISAEKDYELSFDII